MELRQHIQEEHHKISLDTAFLLFEELWEKNEQLNDFNNWGEHGETPHYENTENADIANTILKTPKYPSINWVVSKTAATEIQVEDAGSPMAIETDKVMLETDNDSPMALGLINNQNMILILKVLD